MEKEQHPSDLDELDTGDLEAELDRRHKKHGKQRVTWTMDWADAIDVLSVMQGQPIEDSRRVVVMRNLRAAVRAAQEAENAVLVDDQEPRRERARSDSTRAAGEHRESVSGARVSGGDADTGVAVDGADEEDSGIVDEDEGS